MNKYVSLPFKSIWNSGYFKFDFTNKNSICFIFFSSRTDLEKNGFIKYLRKKYPDSKMVCFFQDLVDLQKNLDINHIKEVFDLVISYDQADAKRYNILYHPTVYSGILIEKNDKLQKSDVFFLGKAKNRFQKIILIYQYLQELGLKCDFYITNVNPVDQIYYEGIHYISNMTYKENLQHVERTACILEIMQENALGYTMRTLEAIMYDKKLLTDNLAIKTTPFYNPSNIFVVDNIADLDKNHIFFENISQKVDYNFKDNISPVRLLEFITDKLEQTYQK